MVVFNLYQCPTILLCLYQYPLVLILLYQCPIVPFMSIFSCGIETIKYCVSGCLKLINSLFIDGKRDPPWVFVSRGSNASNEILKHGVDGINKQKFYEPYVFFISSTSPPGSIGTGFFGTGLNVFRVLWKQLDSREMNKRTWLSSVLNIYCHFML